MSTVLLADDDTAIRTVLTQALSRAGHNVRATSNATTLWRWISDGEGDVVVTDVVMPDENALELLPKIRKLRPRLPVIVMSAQNTVMTAIRAAERGAYEYLPKPFDINELTSIVQRALATPSTPPKATSTDVEEEQLPLIGRSPAMQEIYRTIARMLHTDLTIMIIGESGTGKELVARALHDYGQRQNKPFVALNMAAIPRELIESELFGHEKGAFTGATNRNPGRFEQAEGGTLFLDEIGDMPMEAQTRLLRVLQEQEYTTVGGRQPIKTNVRIVAATHRDLRQLIERGEFREDLFYRLNVVPIRIPSLRERADDIPDLARHFLDSAVRLGLPRKSINTGALEVLKRQRWTGNVRELENLMHRLCALYSEDEITALIAETELAGSDPAIEGPRLVEPAPENLSEAVEAQLAQYFADQQGNLPPPGLYQRALADFERPLISLTLAATNGNQIKTAEILGLNRNTLRKKIKELEIRVVRRPH